MKEDKEYSSEIGDDTFSVYVRPTPEEDRIAITWTRIDGAIMHETSIKLSLKAAMATCDALTASLMKIG